MLPWLTVSLLAMIISAIIASILIPQILVLAFRRKLFDEPDSRKVHRSPVPRLGGLMFMPVICFVTSLLLGLSYISGIDELALLLAVNAQHVSFAFCAMILVFIVGIADDLVGVLYRSKFMVQVVCALLLIAGGYILNNFYGVFWIHEIPLWLGLPFTVVMVVYVMNAFNLIDGIDGLASGLASAAFIIYGTVFGLIGRPVYSMLSFSALGVLVPFFYYNVFGDADRGRKIFMGDTGSLTIGLLLVIVSLGFLDSPQLQGSLLDGVNPLMLAIAPLLIPCFDVARVFIHRLRFHVNPFLPDKNHIHHKLLALGLKPRLVMSCLVVAAVFAAMITIVASKWINSTLLLVIDIAGYTIINIWLTSHIRRRQRALGKDPNSKDLTV